MKPRERLVAALNHKEPDRIPIDLGGCTTGIEVEAYNRVKDVLGFRSETRTFVRDHVEVDEKILERFNVDTRYLRIKAPRSYKFVIESDNSYLDIWGVRYKKPPTSLYWDMVDFPMKESTRDVLAKYKWPDPNDPGITEGLRETAKRLYETTEYALVLDVFGYGVFDQAWALRGMQNFFMDLAMNQQFADALLQRIADYQVALSDHVLREVGEYVQVVMVSDDLGTQNGLMMSPEIYRKLIKPAEKRVWEFIKTKTSAFLFLHSCGSIRKLIPDLIELGVDILNPVQISAKDMDPKELKREFGRDLTFWGGGCDTQKVLPFGTTEEVQEEVKRRISEFAPGGGFVFNPVHTIQPKVPAENIIRMFDTVKKYGTYPIR
jgi:uroporphyrinogen decarboxylase